MADPIGTPESAPSATADSTQERKGLMESINDSLFGDAKKQWNEFKGSFTTMYDEFKGSLVDKGKDIFDSLAGSGTAFVFIRKIYYDYFGLEEQSAEADPTISTKELEPATESEAQSILFLKEKGFNPTNLIELYPALGAKVDRPTYLQYCVWIVEGSISMGLDSKKMLPLMLTFMKIESGFTPKASNSSGATGLLQHMKGLWPERANALNGKHGFSAPPDINNSRGQIYASLQLIARNIPRVANNPKFAAEKYFLYNSGGAHAWIPKHDLMNQPEKLKELYKMPFADRVKKYPGSQTFKSYALARLTAGPPNVFDKAQSTYEKYFAKINGSAVS